MPVFGIDGLRGRRKRRISEGAHGDRHHFGSLCCARQRRGGSYRGRLRERSAGLDADTKFLQCAQAAQADYIVTGNKRHFPAASYGATRVVNAGELLDRITLEI
jgi:hypothetical protein